MTKAKANFSKMTSKKLRGLLETASAEEATVINEILIERNQESPEVPETDVPDVPKTEEPETEAKKLKLSDEEAAALTEQLKEEYVGERVETVPFNTATWLPGTVVGVINDKRTNKPLLAIKLDEGKRIVKAYDSQLVRLLGEKVEVKRSTGTRTKTEKTEEQLNKDLTDASSKVGHKLVFSDFSTKEEVTGTIINAYIDNRSNRVIYRIKRDDDKLAHKTYGSDLNFTGEIDETLAAEFAEREAIRLEILNSPEKRHEVAKAALDKALELLANAQKAVELRQIEFEAATAALTEIDPLS